MKTKRPKASEATPASREAEPASPELGTSPTPPRRHPALLIASGVGLLLWLLALGWLAWHG